MLEKGTFLAVILTALALTAGCFWDTGIDPSQDTSTDGRAIVEGSSYSFTNVDNPASVSTGEAITFAVLYNSEVVTIISCELKDSSGALIAGADYGTVTFTSSSCTYTAPSTMPAGITSATLYIDAGIATDPVAYARLTVNLTGAAEVSTSCLTSYDCNTEDSNAFCYFGTCGSDYVSFGIDTDSYCLTDDDCPGTTCVSIPEVSGGGTCQGLCFDMAVFYSDEFNPPLTEAECSAVEGAQWVDAGGTLGTICITADMATCMGGSSGDSSICIGSLAAPPDLCFGISDMDTCNNSYSPYFASDGDQTRFTYHMCTWSPDLNSCSLFGFAYDDSPCTGGDGGYPGSYLNFTGTYTYTGETSAEACTPNPEGRDISSLTIDPWDGFSFILKLSDYFVTYIFDEYDNTTGVATQSGYRSATGGYRIKIYLNDGKIKVIFTGVMPGVNYACDSSAPGRVYIK